MYNGDQKQQRSFTNYSLGGVSDDYNYSNREKKEEIAVLEGTQNEHQHLKEFKTGHSLNVDMKLQFA